MSRRVSNWRCLVALALVLGCRLPRPAEDGAAPTVNDADASRAASRAEAPAPNVLLITLDTTRADRLGAYGYAKAQTPALDGLAARGTIFTNAYTSSPLTLPAHATIMTGLQPAEHGVRVNGTARLGNEVTTLAETLSGRGYRTGAFVAAFVLDRKFGLDQGFDVYDADLAGVLEQEIPEELSRSRPANVVVGAALEWLVAGRPSAVAGREPIAANRQPPFFAWVHLYDPHYPYYEHPEFEGGPLAGARSYDGDVAFMDHQIGRLLAFLDEHGLAGNTLVIAVADHGEGLGDHGEIEHGHLLNQEVLQVPLIVSLPGVAQPGNRVDAVVSVRDIFPTVIELAGITTPPATGARSLAPALAGESFPSEPSYAETDFPYTMFRWSPQRSLTTAEWKYVRTARPELYDRRDDGGEVFNLATVRGAQAETLESQLVSIEARFRAPAPAPAVALDGAEKDRLEALGYGRESGSAPHAVLSELANLAAMRGLKDMKDMLPVKRADTDLRRGTHFHTLGPEEIVVRARHLVERSPETPMFQSRLGAALVDAGKLAEAAAPLEKALKLDPSYAVTHVDLGRVRAVEGKLDEAISHYREALRLDPSLAAAHFSLANALADLGQLDSSLGHYAEAVRLRPDFVEAHFNMANVLLRRQQPDLARRHYEEALRLDPAHAPAHYSLANLLAERGDDAGAIAHYEEAIRLRSGDVDARNNLAVALVRQKREVEAEGHYREAIRLAPRFARPHYNLGNLLAERDDCTTAGDEYERALEIQPQWWQPAERLAAVLLDCGAGPRDAARALAAAERAVSNSRRTEPQALKTLAAAYAAAGEPERAEETYAAAGRVARERGAMQLAEELDRLAGSHRARHPSSPPA